MRDPVLPFRRLLEVFGQLGIPYMIGGSLASSVHGIPRTTNDIDLIAAVRPEHIRPLAAELSGEFYVDPPEAIEEALRVQRMFNLIHFASSFKFDIYPLKPDTYSQTALARRRKIRHSFDGRSFLEFDVESPEDVVLAKLMWYRSGGAVSERQWADVLDVIRVQAERLDQTYLRHWAPGLKVADLLEEALQTLLH